MGLHGGQTVRGGEGLFPPTSSEAKDGDEDDGEDEDGPEDGRHDVDPKVEIGALGNVAQVLRVSGEKKEEKNGATLYQIKRDRGVVSQMKISGVD